MSRRTVLITGASRGIGEAIACEFAAKGGWNIVIVSHASPDALEKTAEKIRSFSDAGCLALSGDVSRDAFVQQLFLRIRENFGHLDVLVNNAGRAYIGLLQDMTSEDWDGILSVNLKSAFLCTKYAIPQMLTCHSGSIVNISSVWGNTGGSCEAAYSASKGGLNAFTCAMAKELGPSGIRVNAIACGIIDTVMNSQLSPAEKQAVTDEIPLGRMGTPSDVASLAFGIAVKYTYLTGQIITLDGGWT